VANVLCIIERSAGSPCPVCLEALGIGRRLSSEFGATLFAIVPVGREPIGAEDEERLSATLSLHGADRVLLVVDEGDSVPREVGLAGVLDWDLHGRALTAVCEAQPPSVVLFGDSPGARSVAPRLAAKLGAAYLVRGLLETREGKLVALEESPEGLRFLPLQDGLEFPLVATTARGRHRLARGTATDSADVLQLSPTPPQLIAVTPPPAELRPTIALRATASTAQSDLPSALLDRLSPDPPPSAGQLSTGLVTVSLEGAPWGGRGVRVALGTERPGADLVVEGDGRALAQELLAALTVLQRSGDAAKEQP
jgi:hypothetical protein